MSNKINSRVIGFNRRQSYLVLSFIIAVAGLLPSSLTFAVPVATTQVAKLCELRAVDYGFDQYDSGLQPFAQVTACNLSAANASAQGYASAGFGPGIPQVGTTSTIAQIGAYEAIAEAAFSASVQYYFEIQPIGTAPGTAPSLIPVLFSAHGEGYSQRSGYGLSRSVVMAHLFGDPLNFGDAYAEFRTEVVDETAYDPVDEEYQGGGFDISKSLNLYPNYTYGVVISAGCSMWAGPVGQDAPASAQCSAMVDPFLGFDQVAFDTLMGENTFRLDEYYKIAYSENVVPIPAAVWLFGSGLLGLIGVARRRASS